MKDDRAPEDNHQGPVFLGIPPPKTAPGLVGPDPSQRCAQKCHRQAEPEDPHHIFVCDVETVEVARPAEGLQNIDMAHDPSDTASGVSGCDGDDMGA